MDELLEQFLIEGRDLIEQAGDACQALVQGDADKVTIDSAFRAIHTLKGSAAIVGLGAMEAALHAAEDLLSAARSGERAIDSDGALALVSCVDHCDQWIDAVSQGGELPANAAAVSKQIRATLQERHDGRPAKPVAAGAADWAEALVQAAGEQIAAAGAAGRPLTAVRYQPREDCFFAGDDPLAIAATIPDPVAILVHAREDWPALDQLDPYRCALTIEVISAAAESELRELFRLLPDQVELATVQAAAERQETKRRDQSDQAIRVEASQIDRLLDLAGELLVARNQFGQLAHGVAGTGEAATALRTSGAAMDRLLRDMHRAVMGMRMVPLDRLFRRVARLVRETAPRLGREVKIDLKGAETSVDKAIIDALFDPLLHLARNAIDHGIEAPANRRAAGKPASGRLTLSARSVGHQVIITLADDGGGIDPAAMRRLATERGLLAGDGAEGLSDQEAIQLVFAPGFSSAAEVTDLSGRGVGMDVVKTIVERLGGRVLLESEVAAGTTVSIHLPASAALTSVLTVTMAGERYAVPMDSVRETTRVAAEAIRPVGLGRAFALRDETIPFLELSQLLGIDGTVGGGDRKVLVIDSRSGPVGVAVDEFSDRSEVILRPMTGLLSAIPAVAGTTLVGDGSVLFILDLPELIG